MTKQKGKLSFPYPTGAGDESRTRDLNLGKVALYQLSYSRFDLHVQCCPAICLAAATSSRNWSGRRVSNSRPQPWQGCALPTELLPQCASPADDRLAWLSASRSKACHRRSEIMYNLLNRVNTFVAAAAPHAAHRRVSRAARKKLSSSGVQSSSSGPPARWNSGCHCTPITNGARR